MKIFVLSIFEWPLKTGFTVFNETVLVLYQRTASVGQVLNIVAIFSLFIQIYASLSKISWRLYIPGAPKHMKRFESLITFDLTNICCLLFLLINILYIEII